MHSLRRLPILVERSEEIMSLYHGPRSKARLHPRALYNMPCPLRVSRFACG